MDWTELGNITSKYIFICLCWRPFNFENLFLMPWYVKAILHYCLDKLSGFEVMVTQSILTQLPKVSEYQFSAFYSIIGHFQRPLNSNFSPFTGQSIAKCKNSFALAYIFVISLIQVDHLARQEDCQNNWYSILRHPYILLEKFNTRQKLIIHRLAHIELILQVKRKSMKLYWLRRGRGAHHINLWVSSPYILLEPYNYPS